MKPMKEILMTSASLALLCAMTLAMGCKGGQAGVRMDGDVAVENPGASGPVEETPDGVEDGSSPSTDESVATSEEPPAPECLSDADCAGERVCSSGVCVTPPVVDREIDRGALPVFSGPIRRPIVIPPPVRLPTAEYSLGHRTPRLPDDIRPSDMDLHPVPGLGR